MAKIRHTTNVIAVAIDGLTPATVTNTAKNLTPLETLQSKMIYPTAVSSILVRYSEILWPTNN